MVMAREMRAAVFKGPCDIELEMVPVPEIGPRDVLIRVTQSGICGSDLHSYKTGLYISHQQVMGHEFVGLVAEVGAAVDGLAEGDRVTGFYAGVCGECFWCSTGQMILCPALFTNSTGYGLPGAFAEFVAIPSAVIGQNIWRIPDGIDDDTAATSEPVAVALNAIVAAGIKPGDSVVILGAGMIGNASMQAAKIAGASRVGVVEVSNSRLEAARSHGADLVCDARNEVPLEWAKDNFGVGAYHFHEGAMVDVVIECAGSPATISLAFEMVRAGGSIAFVALPKGPELIDISKIVHKLPRVVGSLGGDFDMAIDSLSSGAIHTSDLVTHHFSLEDTNAAFAAQLDVEEAMKVMIKP